MFDQYPIYGGAFPHVGLDAWTNFTKKAMKVGQKAEDMVIPIIQIFNWKAYAQKGQKAFEGVAVEKLRYPTSRELRYMVFTSIALGAPGLSFYSYYRSKMIDRNWAGHVLAPVIHEVKEFENNVDGGRMERILLGRDKELFLTLWLGEHTTFLMLINASSKARRVQQSLGGAINDGMLRSWGYTRNVKAMLKNGRIIVKRMKPWEVLIFKVL